MHKTNSVTISALVPTVRTAKTLYKIIEKNRKEFQPRLDWTYSINSRIDERKFLLKKYFSKETEYWVYVWDQIIGCVGIFNIDEQSKSWEVGVRIDKEYSWHWYITQALKLLEQDNKDISRFTAKIDIHNIKSQHVVENNWYIWEWTLHKYRYSPYTWKNRTMYIYAKVYNTL